MFCDDGFHRPIWGFTFHIDTGRHSLIFCKTPSYGPYESEVMQKMVERLDENSVVEEDNVPRGELVVLSAKPHQENVPYCTSVC